jgi:uncharacterized protein YbaP (TraB family)
MRDGFRRSTRRIALATVLWLASPLLGQATTRPSTQPLFMWKAQSPTATVWLLGSIHVGDDSLYPMAKPIEEAFAQAKAVVFEIDMNALSDPKTALQMVAKGRYPEGQTLSKNVSKETLEALQAWCEKRGVALQNLDALRPWLVSMTVSLMEIQLSGMSTDLGIDRHFAQRAKEAGKTILELETVEAQLGLFEQLTDKEQDGMLAQTLLDAKDAAGQMKRLIAQWKVGDARGMEEEFLAKPLREHPEWAPFMAKMFDDRNAKMAQGIQKLVKDHSPLLVVVGSGHMVGEKGLVRLLQKEGYAIQQVSGPAAATLPSASPHSPSPKPAPSSHD